MRLCSLCQVQLSLGFLPSPTCYSHLSSCPPGSMRKLSPWFQVQVKAALLIHTNPWVGRCPWPVTSCPLCSGHTAPCHFFWMIPAFPAPSAFLPSGVTHCPAPQDRHSMASPRSHLLATVSSLKSPESTGRCQPTRGTFFSSGRHEH